MAEITFEESLRQIGELDARAGRSERAGDWQGAIDAWRALLGHPRAHHQVVDCEILDTIHLVLRRAGRFEGAIAAKREAIAAGYRSVPDPVGDIAECLLAPARRDEAAALFADLWDRDPDDVWLYNSTAYSSYGGVDDSAALRWALDGIHVALAIGDPDQVVDQLLNWAERAWEALGEPPDEALVVGSSLSVRHGSLCRSDPWGDWEPKVERPCGCCGFDPDRTWADREESTRRRIQRRLEVDHPEMGRPPR